MLLATTNIGVIDFRNADDVFRAQVSTAMSEMEVAKMRVRQRRAARQRAERGLAKWKYAFGYLTGEHAADCPPNCKDHHHRADAATAPLVKEAYAPLLAGSSLGEIARMFNAAWCIRAERQTVVGVHRVAIFLFAPPATPGCVHTTTSWSSAKTASRSKATGLP